MSLRFDDIENGVSRTFRGNASVQKQKRERKPDGNITRGNFDIDCTSFLAEQIIGSAGMVLLRCRTAKVAAARSTIILVALPSVAFHPISIRRQKRVRLLLPACILRSEERILRFSSKVSRSDRSFSMTEIKRSNSINGGLKRIFVVLFLFFFFFSKVNCEKMSVLDFFPCSLSLFFLAEKYSSTIN